MKKVISIAIALIILISLVSLGKQEFTIIGKWKGQEKGSTVTYMEFDEEGYVSMRRNDEVMGGKDFKIKGEAFSMFYTTDFEKNPPQLDVTVTRKSTGAQRKMFGVIKIVNNNNIIISLTERIRPENFDGPEAISFKRQ
ncbi:hypothetical protein [Flavobacterium psychrotrophum]|uniref:hypothetical protein n=1 Tax=Flavobacterium psychrotrophum TaxID=2294119 RepID=UPI0013C51132|nr:hypothetical protein [Flavobacterium psychrotrophum]